MNYGDIKNKKLYEQYYQEINADGYNTDELEEEIEKKDEKIPKNKGRNKKNSKYLNYINERENSFLIFSKKHIKNL